MSGLDFDVGLSDHAGCILVMMANRFGDGFQDLLHHIPRAYVDRIVLDQGLGNHWSIP